MPGREWRGEGGEGEEGGDGEKVWVRVSGEGDEKKEGEMMRWGVKEGLDCQRGPSQGLTTIEAKGCCLGKEQQKRNTEALDQSLLYARIRACTHASADDRLDNSGGRRGLAVGNCFIAVTRARCLH